MALFDFLKRNNTNANIGQLPLVQLSDNGGSISEWQPRPTRMQQLRTKLADALLGNQVQSTDNIGIGNGQPVTMKDEITGQDVTYIPQNVSTISQNPRVGGLFNDIMNGAKENFVTGFAAPNLSDNMTSDGRKKGFAYRLGEGLGTAGRFLESAPGRALLTAGAVGLAGGDGADALAYGLQSGALNNRLRTQDRMYRDEMLRNAYNSLINSQEFAAMTPEQKQEAINNLQNQVYNMRGYVTDDMYKNFVNAQQLRDNADWKRLYFDSQQEQNKIMNGLRQDQLEYQKLKAEEDRADRAAQRALTARGQDLSYAGTMARIGAEEKRANNKQSAKLQDAQSTLNQIGLIRDMVSRNPNATGLSKGLITGDLLNRFDNKKGNIETRTAIDSLRTKIRHDLTGAQFSPKEAREYEKFLPNVRDNAQIINAKLDALEKRYYADFGVSLTGNNNPLGLKL